MEKHPKEILKTSKVTSGGWHSRDVLRASPSMKRISIAILSVLVHQMCVLNTDNLVIGYYLSFGKTSLERPKNITVWSRSVMSLKCHQNFNLIIIHENVLRKVFLCFMMPSVYQALKSQKAVWIGLNIGIWIVCYVRW